jgi:hypothetical protein
MDTLIAKDNKLHGAPNLSYREAIAAMKVLTRDEWEKWLAHGARK